MDIVICGSYGHGNLGSEAMARALALYLEGPLPSKVNLTFVSDVTEEDASRISKESKFYQSHKLASLSSFDVGNASALIIGGGNLPANFGLKLAENAKRSLICKIVARIGCSNKEDYLQNLDDPEIAQKTSLLFDHISVRDHISHHLMKTVNIPCHLGSDLAIDSQTLFPCDGPNGKSPYAVLCVKNPTTVKDAEKSMRIARLSYNKLEKAFGKVFIIPFDPMDEIFARGVFKNDEVLTKGYLDPEFAARIIGQSQYVVSVGRIHPLCFAVGYARPCFGISYPPSVGYDAISSFLSSAGMPQNALDFSLAEGSIDERLSYALEHNNDDTKIVEIQSGVLKGRNLEALIPIWEAFGIEHGVGLERGLGPGQAKPDVYDNSYYFGSRIYREQGRLKVYYPSWGYWQGWEIIARLLKDTLNPKTLLDVGCSRGWLVRAMRQRDCAAIGIDGSAAAISRPAPGMKDFISVTDLKDANGPYEVVTAFDVLEHIYEEDIPDFIKLLKSKAAKHLVLNICVKGENAPDTTIERGKPIPSNLEWMAVSGHVTLRDEYWWRAMLADDEWHFDQSVVNKWFADEEFQIPAWTRRHFAILTKRG